VRTLWWSRRAITLHLVLIVAVPVFLALGTWQLRRALHGNMLSWAYVFEWPFFACYATWMWWRLVHEETAGAAEPVPEAAGAASAGAAAAGGEAAPDIAGPLASAGSSRAGSSGPAATQPGTGPSPRNDFDPFDDEADPELAAYNRYLAGLHAEPPKR
jgi:hypothetical protein